MQKRRNEINIANGNADYEEGLENLPENILPDGAQFLKQDSFAVNKKAYAIMEWWRFNTNTDNADIGTPRFKAFKTWGRLIALIALCVPSPAAVERVFSLLKLCKSNQKFKMLHDEFEASMLLRVNDSDI